MMHSDETLDADRLDLSALDPAAQPARWEWRVAAILSAAAPELERRAGAGPITWMSRWALPALPLAAALAGLALGGLAVGDRSSQAPRTITVADALALPDLPSSWLVEGRSPATSDLILAIAEDGR